MNNSPQWSWSNPGQALTYFSNNTRAYVVLPKKEGDRYIVENVVSDGPVPFDSLPEALTFVENTLKEPNLEHLVEYVLDKNDQLYKRLS